MPLHDAQGEYVGLGNTSLRDGLQPHRVWNGRAVKDAEQREAADLGEMNERTSIGDGVAHCSNAQVKSSCIAWRCRSARSTQSIPTATMASSREISLRK